LIELKIRDAHHQQSVRSKQTVQFPEGSRGVLELFETIPDENCIGSKSRRIIFYCQPVHGQPLPLDEVTVGCSDIETDRPPSPLLCCLQKRSQVATDFKDFGPKAIGRADAEIHIICGFRAPASNKFRRTHTSGVAKNSLHMQAEAIDIRLPGTPTSKFRDAALALGRGDVGYYPASDFIHLDVGRVRRW
jgi:hypothetical protein